MEGYYIVRCDRAGVFAGNIKERNGREVVMTNFRRIWYWDGAATLSQLASEGTKRPNACTFSMIADEILLLDAIEISPCTKKAEDSIRGIKEWRV